MAEVAVSFALQLLGVALDEIKLLRGVREDMKWLYRELQRMRCFLLDAERRSLSGDEAVKNWVREITEAAYEAEDIAAMFAPRKGLGFRATLRRYAFRLKELHDIRNDIKSLKEKIVEIGQSRERYGISSNSSNVGGNNNNLVHELRRRPLFQNEEDVIGFENHKNKVMDLLHAEESRCYVIGIVGMGGMGKTTLARLVFNSIDRSQFPKLAWVDLSQKYIENQHNPRDKLLIEIGKQLMRDSPDLESKRAEEISQLVKTNLKEGRYLIVMDDMWETDVWDLIRDHLPDKKNGSRIIITSRKENVVEHPALHFPVHRMEGLDDVQSWDLFTRLVFEDEEHTRRECTGQLKELAEELVCGCGGSPLALTVLGGLLAGKEKSHSAWQDVLGNRKWLQREAGKNCLDILKLSYVDLPHHLKWCFLYLSAFPEDHKIDIKKLITLWVTEGFVAKTNTGHEEIVEDIARTYLEDLNQRCLIQVHEEHILSPSLWERHCLKFCRIHDLVRELSINEATKTNFMNFEIEDASYRLMHRYSLQDNFSITKVRSPSSSEVLTLDGLSLSLRTILNFTSAKPIAFKKLCLLRVLDLEMAKIDKLPEEVGDMVLLRYLSIKDTRCSFLPYSICRLSYLETLDCRTDYQCLIPYNVWKMKTIKHVYVKRVLCRIGISHLIKLQTLIGLLVDVDLLHSLVNLTHLRELSIGRDDRSSNMLLTDIWKDLQSLPSLKLLNLSGFRMNDMVSYKTGFPSLQTLVMSNCNISSWDVEKGSMPSLEVIFMVSCKGLKRLPSGLAQCKKLRVFRSFHGDYEFVQWYIDGKDKDDWEFNYVRIIEVD